MTKFEFILEYNGENYTRVFVAESIGKAWQAFGHWLTTIRAYSDIDDLVSVRVREM